MRAIPATATTLATTLLTLTLTLTLTLLCSCGGGNGGDGSPAGDPPPPPPGAQFLVEHFTDAVNRDAAATDADWGAGLASFLQGQPVTSRKAYIYGYVHTDSGSNSGRGQYASLIDPLTGADLEPVPLGTPPTAQGRRMVFSLGDDEVGAAGTITGIAWGPAQNQTTAATYPNVRLRMGYQDTTVPSSPGLASSITANYLGSPTVIYDGAYTVTGGTVANTPGHPAVPHVGSYPAGFGCTPSWNAQLFDYTGWYSWPALTRFFDWDPGDPSVGNDSVLLFDASVQAGDFHNRMRGWFAVTFPCSGVLIGGYPERTLNTIYEGDAPNPADNFVAGIVNPSPTVVDTCLTITRSVSVAQSRFFAGAFGDDTDYGTPVIVPASQPGTASFTIEFQGADGVEADGVTIDTGLAFTAWVTSIDACDGYQNIRFRIRLNSDLATSSVASIDSITIQMTDLDP